MAEARGDSLQEIGSCVGGYDPKALPVPAAKAFLDRLVPRVQAVEKVAIRAALGRVLARDVISSIDVPAQDNSAMDGYALSSADLAKDGETVLAVAGSNFAGGALSGKVGRGECVRIMTGATMPEGLDTVVPQEFVRVEAKSIVVGAGVVKAGENRRLAGEDLAKGAVALAAGRLLRPADVGILASLGQAEVPVFRRLRVAFFSTGDELRSIGEPLTPGAVYDSNGYTLWAMLRRLGVDVVDLGVVRDEPAALEAAFRAAADAADAVITTGGASVGDADHTRHVLASLGDAVFWRIAMRPGRPMAVGRIGGDERRVIAFGLPGNPVAVMVTFYALVRDALLAMAGATLPPAVLLRAASVAAVRKKPGRTEYQRGFVALGADGRLEVRVSGAQGSGILSSMSQANGLVVLGHEQGNVAAGELVDVLMFDGLV
jgi:molybdopterin molybdotransferase